MVDIDNRLRAGWSGVLIPVRVVFLGIKRPRHGANHCLMFSAKVKNEWRYGSPYMPSCLGQGKSYLMAVWGRRIKVKEVKVTLAQTTKARRGSRCIALLFL